MPTRPSARCTPRSSKTPTPRSSMSKRARRSCDHPRSQNRVPRHPAFLLSASYGFGPTIRMKVLSGNVGAGLQPQFAKTNGLNALVRIVARLLGSDSLNAFERRVNSPLPPAIRVAGGMVRSNFSTAAENVWYSGPKNATEEILSGIGTGMGTFQLAASNSPEMELANQYASGSFG